MISSVASPPAAEIPPLSDAYHKARKSYALFSAVLVAWELIGVDLAPEPVDSIKVTFKNPAEAPPLILITLIVYFCFRVSVEWHHCDTRRRRMAQSAADFMVSHAIAVVALAVYGIQRLLEFQIAPWALSPAGSGWFVGTATGLVIALVSSRWRRTRARIDPLLKFTFVGLIGLVLAFSAVTGASQKVGGIVATASVLGAIVGVAFDRSLQALRARRRRAQKISAPR